MRNKGIFRRSFSPSPPSFEKNLDQPTSLLFIIIFIVTTILFLVLFIFLDNLNSLLRWIKRNNYPLSIHFVFVPQITTAVLFCLLYNDQTSENYRCTDSKRENDTCRRKGRRTSRSRNGFSSGGSRKRNIIATRP